VDGEAFHQPPEFLGGDVFHVVGFHGPLEPTIFQPLIEQDKTVSFPVQGLEAIPPFPTKEEKVVFHGVHVEVFPDDGGKPVDGLAHVGISTGDVDLVRLGDIP